MLDKLVTLLPANLRPYAKAVVPAVVTAVSCLASWIITGTFDSAELKVAVEGAVLSLVAFAFPNGRKRSLSPAEAAERLKYRTI